MINLPNDHFAVTVPEGAYGFEMQGFCDLLFYSYPHPEFPGLPDCNQHLSLPPGSYTIVGLAKDLNNSQKEAIIGVGDPAVNDEDVWWFDYMKLPVMVNCRDHSFRSLLSSLSLDISNVLIVKQNK